MNAAHYQKIEVAGHNDKPAEHTKGDGKHIHEQGTTRVFDIGPLLGKGAFASVYQVTDRSNGQVYAGKYIPTQTSSSRLNKIMQEFKIQSSLSHPSLLAYKETITADDGYYMMLEYCPHGSLANLLRERVVLTEGEARVIIRSICEGIQYMHKLHMIHRDIKPANILIDARRVVRLADFGLAIELQHDAATKQYRHLTDLCGTPAYIAPEVIASHIALMKRHEGREKPCAQETSKNHNFTENTIAAALGLPPSINGGYGKPFDIWSIGVVTHMLVLGYTPFDYLDYSATYESILKYRHVVNNDLGMDEYVSDSPIAESENLSESCRSFIKALLCFDQNKRPTIQEVLEMPWLVESGVNDSECRKPRQLKEDIFKTIPADSPLGYFKIKKRAEQYQIQRANKRREYQKQLEDQRALAIRNSKARGSKIGHSEPLVVRNQEECPRQIISSSKYRNPSIFDRIMENDSRVRQKRKPEWNEAKDGKPLDNVPFVARVPAIPLNSNIQSNHNISEISSLEVRDEIQAHESLQVPLENYTPTTVFPHVLFWYLRPSHGFLYYLSNNTPGSIFLDKTFFLYSEDTKFLVGYNWERKVIYNGDVHDTKDRLLNKKYRIMNFLQRQYKKTSDAETCSFSSQLSNNEFDPTFYVRRYFVNDNDGCWMLFSNNLIQVNLKEHIKVLLKGDVCIKIIDSTVRPPRVFPHEDAVKAHMDEYKKWIIKAIMFLKNSKQI